MAARPSISLLSAALLAASCFEPAASQENNASVTKGVFEFQKILKNSRIDGVIARIGNCWKQFDINKSQDAAAFCFTIDYVANDFAEFILKNEGSTQPETLFIERVISRVNVALKQLRIEQADRGKLIAGWIKTSQRVVTSGQDQEPVITQAENDLVFAKARQAIARKIANPTTARFGNLERHSVLDFKGVMIAVVCGTVDFKLSTGANSDARRFVYFLEDQSAYYDNGMPPPESLDVEIVKNFCSQ